MKKKVGKPLKVLGSRASERVTDKFKTLCHISVDAKKTPCTAAMSPLGFPIFIHEFEVIFIYGQTEFKAQIAWKEEVRLP